jgi:hypothetical protein
MGKKVFSADFSNVVRSLSLLKDDYNDLDMRAGIVRQLANDRWAIFEMDLRSLVDCDIILSNLKAHLPLLRALSRQEVEIISSDDAISFLSERSTFTFKLPRLGYLDNKFLTSEELNKVFPTKDEDLVLQYSIRDDISEFMRLTSQQFNILSFSISYEGEKASILAHTGEKDKLATLDYGIPLKKPLRGVAEIRKEPFLLDHDRDILLKIYHPEGNIGTGKFTTSIGKIGVNVYCRCLLKTEEEEKKLFSPKRGRKKNEHEVGEEKSPLTEGAQEENSVSDGGLNGSM